MLKILKTSYFLPRKIVQCETTRTDPEIMKQLFSLPTGRTAAAVAAATAAVAASAAAAGFPVPVADASCVTVSSDWTQPPLHAATSSSSQRFRGSKHCSAPKA